MKIFVLCLLSTFLHSADLFDKIQAIETLKESDITLNVQIRGNEYLFISTSTPASFDSPDEISKIGECLFPGINCIILINKTEEINSKMTEVMKNNSPGYRNPNDVIVGFDCYIFGDREDWQKMVISVLSK